jgi:hypothetical protein
MALAAIQALYDDDDNDVEQETRQKYRTIREENTDDQLAVINDPEFSVMSKIKLNLTPAILVQVSRRLLVDNRRTYGHVRSVVLAGRYEPFSRY